jgi:D-alanyl-D-alanine dipeptidase
MKLSIGKTIFNWLKRPLILVLLVLAIVFILQKINIIPAFRDWFKSKPLLIENTPLVITQIKTIAQLNTVQMYAEVVADSTIITKTGIANSALRNLGMITIPMAETRKLVLVVKGKIKAGIDLQKLTDNDVFVQGDSVSITLPAATIQELITNPSDFDTFIETGKWEEQEINAVKATARRRLLQEAANQNLLAQASERATLVMEDFLKASGFKKVLVLHKN